MTCLHCDRPVKGRGLCAMHYQQLRVLGHRIASIEPKRAQWAEGGLQDFEKARLQLVPDREPCPRCGIRSDIGCRHSQRWAA